MRRYTAARIRFSFRRGFDMRFAVLCTTPQVVQTKQNFERDLGCMSIATNICTVRRAVMSTKQRSRGCSQLSILLESDPGLASMSALKHDSSGFTNTCQLAPVPATRIVAS